LRRRFGDVARVVGGFETIGVQTIRKRCGLIRGICRTIL
jgi:hypothetical protein